MKFEAILQIFSGGFTGKTPSWEAVERKLRSVLPLMPVRAVIIGWSAERELYEKTASFLAGRGVSFFLWFPVFSETGQLADLGPLVDIDGGRQAGAEGREGGEDFSFCCAGNPENTEKILEIFESRFASIPFDGVFLDKIRYPSFANGAYPPGSVGRHFCFCPECLKAYERENLDIEKLKKALARQYDTPFGIREYLGAGKYVFEDETIAGFFEIKGKIITRSLEKICGHLREKNYGIGLDVFAPFLTPFVGQDLAALCGLCDFIKPMMYRVTGAPAGLPFETEALLKGTGCLGEAHRERFGRILGLDMGKNPFDLEFAARELSGFRTPVYAGLEINRKKNIADVYPDYIEETIGAYARAGMSGFALSWDLLDAPDENIERAAAVMEKLRK